MVRTRRGGPAALAVVLALVLSGCGDDDETDAAKKPSPTSTSAPAPSPSATDYLPVPDGVTLTDQGTELTVGATATVAWQPRQDVTGVLDMTVDRLEQTTIKDSFVGWKIPPETEGSAPYFVRATITNRGDTDLAGRAVPLYIVDADGTLIEATTFASAFKPCQGSVFPTPFASGSTTNVCLVYFAPAPGSLTAVSFRPTQEFDPITWTGELKAPEPTGRKPIASPTG